MSQLQRNYERRFSLIRIHPAVRRKNRAPDVVMQGLCSRVVIALDCGTWYLRFDSPRLEDTIFNNEDTSIEKFD